MKRITALILAALLLLSGCSAAPELTLSEMLGTREEDTYTSPFGFAVDTAQLQLLSEEDLAAVNQVEEFTPEALMAKTDACNAVSVFAAATGAQDSILLSLFPAAGLPEDVQTPEDYAAYGLTLICGKLESAGYTDVQAEQVTVDLDGTERPAVLCTAQIAEGVPYYLLQICFREGGWMAALSLASVESEEALSQLLTRVTSN